MKKWEPDYSWTKEEVVTALRGHFIYDSLAHLVERGVVSHRIVAHEILGPKNPPKIFDLMPKEPWNPSLHPSTKEEKKE